MTCELGKNDTCLVFVSYGIIKIRSLESCKGLGFGPAVNYKKLFHLERLSGLFHELHNDIDHVIYSLDLIKKLIGKTDVICLLNINNELIELK